MTLPCDSARRTLPSFSRKRYSVRCPAPVATVSRKRRRMRSRSSGWISSKLSPRGERVRISGGWGNMCPSRLAARKICGSASSLFEPDDFNHGGSNEKGARIPRPLPPLTIELFPVRFAKQTRLNQHRQVVFEKSLRPFPQWRTRPRDAKEGFDFLHL